ncbi:MAG: alpha/beta hydrolase [Microscillaceae bacterium]|jgi:acetyl esterase|nr:alpha/beta hydrolase [Microscillaceae bacterium]
MALNFKIRLILWLNALTGRRLVDIRLPAKTARENAHRELIKTLDLVDFPPEAMFQVEDTHVPSEGYAIPVRVYRPNAEQNLPILLYFHGGGFVIGNLDIYDRLCRRLAKMANCLVISVDYRLAPEAQFPTPPEDCYAATVWASQSAQKWGGDTTRLAVAGDSAGGNLATVVCLLARERQGPKICQQTLIYPVVDASMSSPTIRQFKQGYFLTKDQMDWFLRHYAPNTDHYNPYLSPLWAKDLSNMPATFLLTAEFDPLKAEGYDYAQKLKSAGCSVVYQDFAGMIHGFFSMPKFVKASQEAQEAAVAHLKKTFAEALPVNAS